jgi:hypothetical protein
MSVVFSGTIQGSFVSTGADQVINLPTGVDWMHVRNMTVYNGVATGLGGEFFWQREMIALPSTGLEYLFTNITGAMEPAVLVAPNGFMPIDTSVNVPGASIATTGITGALPPVVTTGSTVGLNNGDIVRLFSPAGALQLGGMDFTVGGVVANTSFTLPNMPAVAAATPAVGAYRRIPYNPYFYPSSRYITKISQAAQALVTLSVTHSYTIGQVIRFVIPTVTAAAYGMTEINGLQGTIVNINQTDGTSTNTITVDINTAGFTAFALPLTANPYHTFAQVVPVGESTVEALIAGTNLLGDATVNTGIRGLMLAAGNDGPAGNANDLIVWVAGKSANL